VASTHVEQAPSSLAAWLVDERARGDHDIEATPEIELEHGRRFARWSTSASATT
jgi:hypothetical protein